jgi:RimJ/RimL family protein N-acetyltransferase
VQIETERLLLRPLTIDDLDELIALHAEPALQRFMGPFDRARLTEWVSLVERDWAQHGYGRAVVLDRVTGRFLGRAGLKRWLELDETDIGWILHPDNWGRGLATEAARALARWGFENLDVPYLIAMIRADNQRSLAVAERLGMTLLREGPPLEEDVYSVSRETWATADSHFGTQA